MRKYKKLIIGCVSIVLLLFIYIGVHAYFFKQYNTSFAKTAVELQELQNFGSLKIESKKLSEESYMDFNGIYLLKSLSVFEHKGIVTQNSQTIYEFYDENRKVKEAFYTQVMPSVIKTLETDDSYSKKLVSGKDYQAFFQKYHIEDDVDLYDFVANYHFGRNTLFTPITKMKENYIYHMIVTALPPITAKIEGDKRETYFRGNVSKNQQLVVFHLLKKDKTYVLAFWESSYFTEDYIKEIVSTAILDQ